MAYVVAKKSALLIPSGPGEDGKHLYVIVTAPCEAERCLLVTLTSIRDGRFFDPACRVDVGEHEFITKPSYVEYHMSRTLRCEQIVKCVDGWYFTPKPPASEELVERLCAGLTESDFTSKIVLDYFAANRHR
ncbi:hypothetical protein FJW06_05400 [Mesorhizobium sp. B4-1-3]|uniref:hypothetical protein n=1 Tax=Mesorhizobium sp. B4-1-3 TaxID=2589889 RepID=UPI001126DDCA|nr:hypothetical protein [Mesorhizobium sp. B4-1-3]TPI15762.1 hypothetical protein FJW06_05400 [Mesorhizobium sp. B4-1-3]